jgi:hypothetical protein
MGIVLSWRRSSWLCESHARVRMVPKQPAMEIRMMASRAEEDWPKRKVE